MTRRLLALWSSWEIVGGREELTVMPLDGGDGNVLGRGWLERAGGERGADGGAGSGNLRRGGGLGVEEGGQRRQPAVQ